MLFVDGRDGSSDVLLSLQKAGLPAEEAVPNLPAGDIYFIGRGLKGVPVNVGIEHKSVADMVDGFKTGRLAGAQLPGMRAADEGEKPAYDFAWLCIEGELIFDARGQMMRKGAKGKLKPLGISIDEVYKRLTVLHLCGGLNWVHCETRRETVKWVGAMYRALTDKDLDQHKSHLAIYQAPTLVPLSQVRRTLATLPGVMGKVSKSAEVKFKSIRRAVNASKQEWAALETIDDKGKARKFGIKRAETLVESVI